MTTFLKVPDKIEQLSEGEIQRHFIPPLVPAMFFLLGMALIWFGGWEAKISGGESFLMTILGSAIILICVVVLLAKERSYFVIKSTMSRIKPIRISLDTLYQQEAVDLISENKINEILKLKTTIDSPLCLEVWFNKKHNKVYSQLFYYYDAGMRPISLVHVTKFLDLDLSQVRN
ncbi:MAG: hypothetical protein RR202_02975 [Bacteroidales bacterium]